MPPQKDSVIVSIIIPARNEGENLAALLSSLSALKFPQGEMEVVVVDHESSDNTKGVALRWGAKVLTKKGGTISSVRNLGASVATGQILAFIDADCTVAEDWLTKALPYFADPQIGAVGSGYPRVPLDPPTWVRKVLQKQMDARPRLTTAKWLSSGNMLVRRHVFWECQGFDEALTTCEDADLSYRIAKRYRLISDINIRWWHHGEPKTLRDLFRKESWRGRHNFLAAFRHGFRLSEIPSLLLPLYFMAALIALLASPLVALLLGWWVLWWIIWSGTALFLPLLLMAELMSVRMGDHRYVLHLAIFFGVYFLARGLAPFYKWRNI